MILTKELATKSHNKHDDNNENIKRLKGNRKGWKVGDDGCLPVCHVPEAPPVCHGCLYL